MNALNLESLASQLKHCTDSERLELLTAIQRKETYLKVLNNFAVNLIQINNYDDLIWYVTKEVVAQLGFVDCVIYQLHPDTNMLIQRAATGAKNPEDRILLNPMHIPVGRGVTGKVAAQAKPIIVKDLSKFPDYVPDVDPALSEICVPLIHGGEVLGVIDCEDPRPHHFNNEHLEVLTSVASMTSSKIKEGEVIRKLEEKNLALTNKQDQLKKAISESEEARRANDAKDRFLANTSHELRTPLTGIMGMIDLLGKTPLSDEQKELVSVAGTSADALLSIINDILDLAKMEADKVVLRPGPIDVVATVQEAAEILRPKAELKGLTYNILMPEEASTPVMADQSRLRQIIFNLVGNAVKFTHEGKIDISLNLQEQAKSTSFELIVDDTGIGFASEAADNIFKRFEQLDTSSCKDAEGTGLGLSIAAELADMMGGTIEAESQVGEGSSFYFRTVFQQADELPQQDEEKQDDQISAKKELNILVAEDHKINQLLISKLLMLFGWKAKIVENGQLALDVLKAGETFDLILMDIRMPVMDGETATKAIRALPDHKNTPIVALTANALPEDAEAYMEAGMNAVVPKPIDKELLYDTVVRTVSASNSQ